MGRLHPETLSDGDRAEMQRRREESDREYERQKRLEKAKSAWHDVTWRIGKRYSCATFDTFSGDTPAHSAVLAAAREYAESIATHAAEGRGLLIHGPRGTGKDHLAVAALRACAQSGLTVGWTDGQELFAAIRDSIGKDDSERWFTSTFLVSDVLLISDPVPPEGKITEFQQTTLWRIIDRRYRGMKLTWITANCKDGEELSQRLGPQLVDRLTDDAVVISTVGMKSHRKPFSVIK